jgi:hypothetical protein
MKRSGIQDSFTKLSTAHINRPKWRKPTHTNVPVNRTTNANLQAIGQPMFHKIIEV